MSDGDAGQSNGQRVAKPLRPVLVIAMALFTVPHARGDDMPDSVARPRVRELGIEVGVLPPGRHNAITDVAGVLVGHATLVRESNVRTGVTAVLPHGGNLFQEKVPAA